MGPTSRQQSRNGHDPNWGRKEEKEGSGADPDGLVGFQAREGSVASIGTELGYSGIVKAQNGRFNFSWCMRSSVFPSASFFGSSTEGFLRNFCSYTCLSLVFDEAV